MDGNRKSNPGPPGKTLIPVVLLLLLLLPGWIASCGNPPQDPAKGPGHRDPVPDQQKPARTKPLFRGPVPHEGTVPAPKPLYRDPVHDGAADPSLIWNGEENKWFMFYTNRRANVPGLEGVSWVHGTRIGIAESRDGGRTWTYLDTCDIRYRPGAYTHWAPDVVFHNGTYHMFLTWVPGIFRDWKHPRSILHLTSKNLLNWTFESSLDLASDKCIDACVFRLPDGTWRMYYNNERDGKSIYFADSPDLYTWTDSGQKVIGDRAGEGPVVFQWKGKYWMLVDNWRGLGVYSSRDLIEWKRQGESLLSRPGTGPDDGVIGQHPDVIVSGDCAYLFYFTHPGRTPGNRDRDDYSTRRSSIQVAELRYIDGRISCDRDEPVCINLTPEAKKPPEHE